LEAGHALRVITPAYDIQRRLCEDPSVTVREIAQEQITPNYLYVVLRVRWLAPDIVTAIVDEPAATAAQHQTINAAYGEVTRRLGGATSAAGLSLKRW
jgi:hypothetical protein